MSEDAAPTGENRITWPFASVVGALAAVIAFVAIQAWLAGTNDPDSMASILYFQRLTAGQHLEVTVLTTPKPILTLVYGLTWNLAHDWRTVVWETIAIHGVSVALAVVLAGRLAGAAAAAFVAVVFIGSSSELAEVAQANSLPWAVAGWLIAGVAVASRPPRFGIAGTALLIAGLARIETWLIMVAATLVLASLAVPAVRSRKPTAPNIRAMLPLMLGWIAVPIQLAHDLLLAGDPLYWLGVPREYTTLVTPDLQPVGALHFALTVADRLAAMPIVTLLAAAGVVYLVAARRIAMLIGLAGLVVGGFALLGSLAVRGTYISERYYEGPMLGILFAAGIGVGATVAFIMRRTAGSLSNAAVQTAGAGGAIVLGVVLCVPGPLTPELHQRFELQHAASANLETVTPRLSQIMASVQGPAPSSVPLAEGITVVDPQLASMYVPRPLSHRVAIELELPLTRLGDGTVASRLAPADLILVPGQFVYHDANVDVPEEWFAPFEIETESLLGELRLVPLDYESEEYWLVAVEE